MRMLRSLNSAEVVKVSAGETGTSFNVLAMLRTGRSALPRTDRDDPRGRCARRGGLEKRIDVRVVGDGVCVYLLVGGVVGV